MTCTVTLTIQAESTAWGETIGVAGSIPELSTWGVTTPPSLAASPFPVWIATLTLPADTLVQYKYVVLSSSNVVRWEVLPPTFENRSFTTPPDGHTLAIDDGVMGDNNRSSATVTPSITPTVTPTTTPTRPQKLSDLTMDLFVQQQQQQQLEQQKQQQLQPLELHQPQQQEQHSLAEFTAQLDNSRRQIEHVRAAVRRIRRIPTPDALPTPPSTPNHADDLSHDAAAALVNHTLNKAKADVDVICEKLRAVRTAKSKPIPSRRNPFVLAGVIGFAASILVIVVILFYTQIRPHVHRVEAIASDMFGNAVMAWENITLFGENTLKAARSCNLNIRTNSLARLVQGAEKGAVHAVERVKMLFVPNLQDWLTALLRVTRAIRGRVEEQVGKFVARVSDLRIT